MIQIPYTGAAIIFNVSDMPCTHMQFILWSAFAGFILLAIILAVAIKFYFRRTMTGREGLAGAEAEIVEWSGNKGRVRVMGEIWTAQSKDKQKFKKEDNVIIEEIDELTLKIKPPAKITKGEI